MQSLGVASSEDLDRLMSGVDAHLMLEDTVSGVPQLDALTLVDASGKLVTSSRAWPTPENLEINREYVRALTSDGNLRLFLSEPARSRRTGAWSTYLARRLVGPNGEFIGMIVGVMELRHFEQFFGSISTGKDAAIALFRSDGLLWCARRHGGARPHPFTPFERRIPPNRAPAAAGRAATWRAPHARRARYARRQANRPAA
jgi:cache domain-containing protein